MKFLEEETPIETINNGPTTNEQDGEDEDLVCRKKIRIFKINFLIFYFSLILFNCSNIHKTILKIDYRNQNIKTCVFFFLDVSFVPSLFCSS